MLEANFTVTPSAGYVLATSFAITNNTQSDSSIQKYIWDPGTGIITYDTINPTFVYNYPGTYTITLTAIDLDNNTSVATQDISVDLAYRDYVNFTQIPDIYADPGLPTPTPFQISVISSNPSSPLNVDLYAANSLSTPKQFVPNKWNFLTPTWYFTDLNSNIVTTLSVTPVPVYINNVVVALSGTAQFYFVDSMSTGSPLENCPLLITATLQTSAFSNPNDSDIYSYPSYANNQSVRVGLLWQVNDLIPNKLNVTSNYLNNIYPIQYKGIKIPTLVTYHCNKSILLSGASNNVSGILFSYPTNNNIGKQSPLLLSLSGINSFTLEQSPLYVQNTDTNGALIGGYVFTAITPLSSKSATTIVAQTTAYTGSTSSSTIRFPYPKGYAPIPSIWTTDSVLGTLNKITLTPYTTSCTTITDFKNKNALLDGYVKTYNVSPLTGASTFNYYVTGTTGIYGIAVDPRDYSALVTNTNNKSVNRYTASGILTASFSITNSQLSASLSATAPAGLTLDRDCNIWTSLLNSTTVLKLNPNLNLLLSASPASIINRSLTSIDPGYFPAIETDKNNNCWATYSFPLCSLLVRYTSTGTPLTTITLPRSSVPTSLAIDVNNNVWVSNGYSLSSFTDSIQLYNGTNYSLMSTISGGLYNVRSLSLNRNGNIWFTHSARGIGYIDTTTGNTRLWYNDPSSINSFTSLPTSGITNNVYTTSATNISANFAYDFSNATVDVYDRFWFIDTTYNTAYVIITAVPDAINNNNNFRTITITPSSTLSYFTTSGNAYYRSAQSIGDWTGNKWYQKYTSIQSTSAIILSGNSNEFTINNFTNPYQIRRINESFNLSKYHQALALPENLNTNTILFNQFFPGTVGTGYLSANEDIGQITYERTANFVQNHSDVDTCLIDQIQNLAQLVDITPKTYSTNYPREIKNLIDIASIPMSKLWGIQDKTPLLPDSAGAKYNTRTDLITAGTFIVLQSLYDNTYSVTQVPPLNNLTVYPLSSYKGFGFIQPVLANYNFYRFVPVYSGDYIGNIIDWNSPQTTLTQNLSTFNTWYGDNGIIETAFRYLLTKNLFLNNT